MLYIYDILEKYPDNLENIDYNQEQVVNNVIESSALIFQLKKIKLPKIEYSSFISFLNELNLRYDKSLIAVGESVGVIAAQSIGESLTQATLNSFHNTGVKKAGLTGISRLTELLDASSTPNVIYFSGIETSEAMVRMQL